MPSPPFQPEHESAERISDEGSPSPDEILWAVLSSAAPEGVPVREIIAATRMSRRWVFYRLQQLAAAGQAVQIGRGYWRAAP